MITITYNCGCNEDIHDMLFEIINTFKLSKAELMAIYEEVEEDGKDTGDN